MIYLLVQMFLYLALASVAGGAVGWLLHRGRAGHADEALRETIVRQHHQLRHAETDVAILTEDFDDLKQRSQSEIESLRSEARRVPALLQNLDKSQSLVRQLMQKHEAQLRELTQHNDALRERVAAHEEREAALARARSELQSARAELGRLRDAADAASADAVPTNATPADAVSTDATPADAAATDAVPAMITSADAAATDAVPAVATSGDAIPADTASHDAAETLPAVAATPIPESPSRGSGVRINGAGTTLERVAALPPPPASSLRAEPAAPSPEHDDALDAMEPGAFFGPVPLDPEPNGHTDDYGIDDRRIDEIDEIDDDFEEEDDDDGLYDESVELMFEPVDRHDDLQRIFGIGPVTERALNRLGITSYSQLAELESTDVERIADALQIYSGRIERDDWVGNARRQLEDVLEEL